MSAIAGEVSRTIVISAALYSLAMNLRVAQVSCAATTNRAMILTVALCVYRTLVLQDARIHALSVVASGSVVALAV